VWAGHSLEEQARLLLAAADALDTFDVGAVKHAYRRAIQSGLPRGFALRGRYLHGPAQELKSGSRALADVDATTLLERHRSALERAVNGPGGDPVAYFWQIAAPYRLRQRVYGTWRSITGDPSPEATVKAALDRWGRVREHAELLYADPRHDFDALYRAIAGDFGADSALVDRVTRHYRDGITAALPAGFTLDGEELRGPHPAVGTDARGAVHGVDLDAVITATVAPPRELLTTTQVADLISAGSADSARRTLARWGVTAAEQRPSPAGHLQPLFDADQVHAAWKSRPGRGRRTSTT
jgi:hypothetical protein